VPNSIYILVAQLELSILLYNWISARSFAQGTWPDKRKRQDYLGNIWGSWGACMPAPDGTLHLNLTFPCHVSPLIVQGPGGRRNTSAKGIAYNGRNCPISDSPTFLRLRHQKSDSEDDSVCGSGNIRFPHLRCSLFLREFKLPK
jgi:hypothetical protein